MESTLYRIVRYNRIDSWFSISVNGKIILDAIFVQNNTPK